MSSPALLPAPLDAPPAPSPLRAQRCACQRCGVHSTGLVGGGTVGGCCGNCGSHDLVPVIESRPRRAL